MKNKIIRTLCVLMALSFAFFLFSCTKDSCNPSEEVKYEINRTSIRLEMLETFQLSVENATDVQWSSDNEAIAVVDENGLVTGVSKGNATIKAKFSSGTCECVVTVMESNDLPYLVVESDEISLLQNGTYTIDAKVYFKNQLCEDATINFEILDKTIASVDENGLITGIATGTTQLNVSASWKVFNDILALKKTITINVKNGVSVEILSSVKDLYTTDINVYGKSFESKTQLDVLITNYGVELAKENISWRSSDESVATVDQNGLVQAVGVGNATIKASYSKDGLTSASIPYEIEVTKPYIDLTEQYPVLVDCWLDADKTTIQKDLADVFDSEHTITAVRDENGQSVSWYNVDNFTFDKDKVTVGECVWEIENEDYIVKTGVFFATKILTTAEDLVKMQEYGKIALFETHTLGANSVDEYRYQGYFALGNDIVFGSDDYGAGKTYISNINMYSGSIQKASAGFYGVFEGAGHSIKNAKLDVGGLFGDVSEQGVIRNLNVYNASLTGGNQGGVIARNVSGKLENVNITVDLNEKYGSAAIAYLMYGGTLENVTVYASEVRSNREGAPFIFWTKGAISVKNASVNDSEYRLIASDEASILSKLTVNKFDYSAQNKVTVYAGTINAQDFEVMVDGTVKEVLYAGRNMLNEVDVAEGKVTFKKANVENDFFVGNNTVKIVTDKTDYQLTLIVSEYAINTAKDFEDFISYLNTGKTLYGKVVNIGADIDFADYVYTANAKGLRGKAGDSGDYGFNGTMNGNGHVIKNMKVEWTLFNRTYNAIIRDLAFVDLEFQQNYVKGLITKADGTTTIENVYIKSSHNACYNRDYAIAETVGGKVTIKNCIIDRTHAVKGYLVGTINGNASLTLSNVYAIGNTSAVAKTYNEQTLIGGEGVISTKENALSTITTAGLNAQNGWNMALWSINEQGDLLFRNVVIVKNPAVVDSGITNVFLESMDNGVVDDKNWEGLLV